MWRYGRLFDETFMADLQTRTCPKLVYMLASALKMEAPETHGGILGIAQLSDVSEENKKKCTAAAAELLRRINRYLNMENADIILKKKKSVLLTDNIIVLLNPPPYIKINL